MSANNLEVRAPMPCAIIEVQVSVGDEVKSGDSMLLVESMKMEVPIVAEQDGRVAEICVAVGDAVEADSLLLRFATD